MGIPESSWKAYYGTPPPPPRDGSGQSTSPSPRPPVIRGRGYETWVDDPDGTLDYLLPLKGDDEAYLRMLEKENEQYHRAAIEIQQKNNALTVELHEMKSELILGTPSAVEKLEDEVWEAQAELKERQTSRNGYLASLLVLFPGVAGLPWAAASAPIFLIYIFGALLTTAIVVSGFLAADFAIKKVPAAKLKLADKKRKLDREVLREMGL